jgi:hypothetical protein
MPRAARTHVKTKRIKGEVIARKSLIIGGQYLARLAACGHPSHPAPASQAWPSLARGLRHGSSSRGPLLRFLFAYVNP